MESIVSKDAMDIMLNKLLEKTPVKYGTGQNNLWFDQNYVYYAIITENGTKHTNSTGFKKLDLKELVDDYLSYCLVVQLMIILLKQFRLITVSICMVGSSILMDMECQCLEI